MIVKGTFLTTTLNTLGEAKRLFIEALDEHVEEIVPEVSTRKKANDIIITEAINETLFPPCMKLTLAGLEDGRKRGLFTLLNFLRSAGWSQESAKTLITEWNKRNKPPLSTTIIDGQLNHSYSKKEALPPNCSNAGYYLSYGVCKPDTMCQKISNPANYTLLKWRQQQREKREQEIDAKEREQEKEAEKN